MDEEIKKSEIPKSFSDFYDFYLNSVVMVLVVSILIFVFISQQIMVDGHSMEPTLSHGERGFIVSLGYEPQQGDIIAFRKYKYKDDLIIKRVIATEGQTVDIDFSLGEVWVDGILLDEDYINETTTRALDFTDPVVVPEGCVFVMGDNRNHSNDSRDDLIGFVDKREIAGKLYLRIFPIKSFGPVE